MDPSVISDLKLKHGVDELLRIVIEGQVFLAKMPDEGTWQRFMELGAGEAKWDAFQGLVSNTVVFPDNAREVFRRRPGLVVTVGNEVAEFAGLTKKVESGKV